MGRQERDLIVGTFVSLRVGTINEQRRLLTNPIAKRIWKETN